MNLLPYEDRHYLTPAELAALCGVSSATIWRAVKSGKIKGHQIGPRSIWRIPKKEAAKILNKLGFAVPKELLK